MLLTNGGELLTEIRKLSESRLHHCYFLHLLCQFFSASCTAFWTSGEAFLISFWTGVVRTLDAIGGFGAVEGFGAAFAGFGAAFAGFGAFGGFGFALTFGLGFGFGGITWRLSWSGRQVEERLNEGFERGNEAQKGSCRMGELDSGIGCCRNYFFCCSSEFATDIGKKKKERKRGRGNERKKRD